VIVGKCHAYLTLCVIIIDINLVFLHSSVSISTTLPSHFHWAFALS
jgi:hypothetical protein